jgi:hypothetical protein
MNVALVRSDPVRTKNFPPNPNNSREFRKSLLDLAPVQPEAIGDAMGRLP